MIGENLSYSLAFYDALSFCSYVRVRNSVTPKHYGIYLHSRKRKKFKARNKGMYR